MSDYQTYLKEKEQIDVLLHKGYQMISVKENLSGAFLQFEKDQDVETLQITTAEARKYFSTLLIMQANS
ncbi:hypothetical protein ACFDTO_15640 [Microbacteriaceae bacterium 4G12]